MSNYTRPLCTVLVQEVLGRHINDTNIYIGVCGDAARERCTDACIELLGACGLRGCDTRETLWKEKDDDVFISMKDVINKV